MSNGVTSDDRVAAIEADTARLLGATVNYADDSIPIDVRIRHAMAAKDYVTSRVLKNQKISRLTRGVPVDDTVDGAVASQAEAVAALRDALFDPAVSMGEYRRMQDEFASAQQHSDLDERIAAAEAAKDYTTSRLLKNQKIKEQRSAPKASARVESLREQQEQRQAQRAEVQAEADAALERSNEARRQQHAALQRLPKDAREIAMKRVFGGPDPA